MFRCIHFLLKRLENVLWIVETYILESSSLSEITGLLGFTDHEFFEFRKSTKVFLFEWFRFERIEDSHRSWAKWSIDQSAWFYEPSDGRPIQRRCIQSNLCNEPTADRFLTCNRAFLKKCQNHNKKIYQVLNCWHSAVLSADRPKSMSAGSA